MLGPVGEGLLELGGQQMAKSQAQMMPYYTPSDDGGDSLWSVEDRMAVALTWQIAEIALPIRQKCRETRCHTGLIRLTPSISEAAGSLFRRRLSSPTGSV